jgi:hypothetical protein
MKFIIATPKVSTLERRASKEVLAFYLGTANADLYLCRWFQSLLWCAKEHTL